MPRDVLAVSNSRSGTAPIMGPLASRISSSASSADWPLKEQSRRMAPTGIVDPPRGLMIDAVPDREKEPVLLLHLERVVEGSQHLARHPEIGLRKGL